jgi:hypothetical protein
MLDRRRWHRVDESEKARDDARNLTLFEWASELLMENEEQS